MKYRKKPVVIEAVKWIGDWNAIWEFVHKDNIAGKDKEGELVIRTLEGNMKVSINDYIIKGIQGEFYPCKPDIFEQTYEKVEEE